VSHQFPVALVVTADVTAVGVVVDTVVVVTGFVEVVTIALVVVVVVVVVVLVVVEAEPHDESSTAATNTRDKLNQTSLCFTLYLHFYL
jgi:hypothetical protein